MIKVKGVYRSNVSGVLKTHEAKLSLAVDGCAHVIAELGEKIIPEASGDLKNSRTVIPSNGGMYHTAIITYKTPYALYQYEGISRSGNPLVHPDVRNTPPSKSGRHSKWLEKTIQDNYVTIMSAFGSMVK